MNHETATGLLSNNKPVTVTSEDTLIGEEILWYYNCKDCVYTDEVGQVELRMAKEMGLQEVYDFQQLMFWPVLQAMQRGVRIDDRRRADLAEEVIGEIKRREDFIAAVCGHPLNVRSPKQMHLFFYSDLALKPIKKRQRKGKEGKATLEDDALQQISRREPLLKPLINAISDIRTMGIFKNMLTTALDDDGRMRCAYNIGGSASGKSAPKTYRLSSSENAFGSGTNLQNIPSEKSKSLGKASARGATAGLGDPYSYPNLRRMFIPDDGYVFFDGDLDRADLQVVAWEAEDDMLKAALRLGTDIHLMNAYVLEGRDPPPLEELVERHRESEACTCGPRCYWDYRKPLQLRREFAKVFCHGTNYGGQPRTMAAGTGRTISETERAQKIWFGAHPGIHRWHERVKHQISTRRFIQNRFGYRYYVFDRVDSVVPECIAWVPQSTVAVLINKIWLTIYETLPDVQVLLQCHDSICGQVPVERADELIIAVENAAKIVIPYEDPLIIPFSVKTSAISWGDCQ